MEKEIQVLDDPRFKIFAVYEDLDEEEFGSKKMIGCYSKLYVNHKWFDLRPEGFIKFMQMAVPEKTWTNELVIDYVFSLFCQTMNFWAASKGQEWRPS